MTDRHYLIETTVPYPDRDQCYVDHDYASTYQEALRVQRENLSSSAKLIQEGKWCTDISKQHALENLAVHIYIKLNSK